MSALTPAESYDLIVLGGGSAGYAAARTYYALAPSKPARIAIIDGAPELGGLCILRGCMPSKTLIYSAEVLHLAQKGKEFGLSIPEARVCMSALQQRKRAMVEEFASYRREQLTSEKYTLYRQRAHFLDPHTLVLSDGQQLRARHFVLATGSEVQWPQLEGLNPRSALSSDEVLDLASLPESVIVLGGGIVAIELAQYLARIGSRVTLIQRSPRILKECSPEAAAVLERCLRREGIELFTDTQLLEVTGPAQGDLGRAAASVSFMQAGKRIERCAQVIFNALGRRPATLDLALEAAGIEQAPSGHILTNGYQQSSAAHIYAAGDCARQAQTAAHEVVHVAIQQAELAAQHALGLKPAAMSYDTFLSVVFSDPQIAHIGLTEAQLQERGLEFITAAYPFNDHGKSILMLAGDGYVKLWASPGSGKLLAAECVSKDASELIHALSVAITLGASARDLLRVQWYHPTLSEIWTYPLEEIVERVG